MENVRIELRGTKLVLEVDLAAEGTTTGKGNVLVGSSGGWARLPEVGDGWSVNMVVVRKAGARVPASRAA